MATLAVTGTLRTTPNDLLDAHAGLLPTDLMLKKICHQALTRICALPPTNPAALQALKYHDRPARKHLTNIQHLLKIFGIDPSVMEDIPAAAKPPSYKLPIDIVIANSKEESIEEEARDDATIRIYTDSSSQNGFVGTAAVMYHPRNRVILEPSKVLRYRLGTDEEYSVWDVEAAGGLMALWLLRG
ncbi:hypothetical protein BYT27DRAFT_7099039, partial [Phlegmacium glaucopus]